jgi:hypothetical protein
LAAVAGFIDCAFGLLMRLSLSMGPIGSLMR